MWKAKFGMVKREFIDGGKLLKYTLPNVSREALRIWAELVQDDTNKWDIGQPYPALHDFTAIEALTPSLRHYTTEVSKNAATKQLVGVYVAVLLKPGIGFRLANTFLVRELSRLDKNVHFQAFHNSEDALSWLREKLQIHSSQKLS